MVDTPERLLKRSSQARDAAKDAQVAVTIGERESVPAQVAAAVAVAKRRHPEHAQTYGPKARRPILEDPDQGARFPGWMIVLYILVPLLFIALSVTALANVEEEEASGQQASGANGMAIYSKYCSGCHGANGQGTGAFPSLDKVTSVFPQFETMYEWVQYIANETTGPYGEGGSGNGGKGATKGLMPAFGKDFGGTLTASDLYAVVASIRTEFGGEASSKLPPPQEYGAASATGAGG